MALTGFVPFDTANIKWLTSASKIPKFPDPSITYMIWDGINPDNAIPWRKGESVVMYDMFGLTDGSGHIAQISGSTGGTFAVPGGLKIPAYMLRDNSKVLAQVEATKVGANGTANLSVTLGILNSASDGVMSSISVPSATGSQMFASSAARFGVSTTKFNTRNSLGEGVTQASSSTVMYDRINNIDTTQDMWVNINISSANSADVFNLIGVQVKLEY